MTTWLERRPGSEKTLLALYDAVVTAEEFDLAGQADVASCDDSHPESGDPVVEDADDDSERPSMAQALGVVEHLLGGCGVADGESPS